MFYNINTSRIVSIRFAFPKHNIFVLMKGSNHLEVECDVDSIVATRGTLPPWAHGTYYLFMI